MEVLPDNYGFLRCDKYTSDAKDTYVPPTLIRKFNLKTGDYIKGKSKYQRENDKYQALCYMAIVSMASFTQSNYELGYALKFVRIITLCLVALLGAWGLLIGALIGIILVVSTRTVNGKRSYLYPLFPFNPVAMSRLIFRRHKH